MINKTEAYFISHCEDDYCDLGSFDYECPSCNKRSSDYNVWWDKLEIYSGILIDFKCEKCKADLQVYWDEEELEYYVKTKIE